MTTDQAAALSLLDALPRRQLTARLVAGDPLLAELANPLLEHAARARTAATHRGIGFVAWNEPSFPAALLAIPDCPPGLWFRGDLTHLTRPVIAIVGSRSGSAVALETAHQLAEGLAACGVTVASGLARGVDSAAHRGALRTGRTVAVLGSGHDRLYPAEHRTLADQIAASGAVLSEYPPDVPALPFHFPLRNRIISGLSRGVVVVEAAEESGSLITAAYALEQGREVMAVPGNVLSGRNRGGHALLRDGARIVESASDVLEELKLSSLVAESAARSCEITSSVDPLLKVMKSGEAYELEQLTDLSGVSASQLLPRLSALELDGRIRRAGGGRFIRTS